ncbi:MAG: hypothetical protein ABJC87_23510 [Roseobacter sp.]
MDEDQREEEGCQRNEECCERRQKRRKRWQECDEREERDEEAEAKKRESGKKPGRLTCYCCCNTSRKRKPWRPRSGGNAGVESWSDKTKASRLGRSRGDFDGRYQLPEEVSFLWARVEQTG